MTAVMGRCKKHNTLLRFRPFIGDAWSMLVLREVFYGVRRFDAIQTALGVSRNVLTRRLGDLVDHEILERRPYQDNPPRYDCVPTKKGRALFDVILAMMRFGDDWLTPEGAPVEGVRRDTDARIRPKVVDENTGEPIDYRALRARLGPGFPDERRSDPDVVERFGQRD